MQSMAIRKIVGRARPPSPDFVLDGECLLVSGLTLAIFKPTIVDPDTKLPVAVVSAFGRNVFLIS